MTCINFEDLLGKHISFTEKITGFDFEETDVKFHNSENRHYSIKSKLDDSLFEVRNLYGIP
ncbi:hypothetical protein FJ651_03960 [Paucihalobacter ruber]|uniref:Uncharacterized protein n=1 Tax=Paucihalobacter ruber TaxID=2567861 RepID=A0A506PN99_9FLAO|nr:hypothetical protein [Paucihalobacter ruber]TPV34695.1 hypothetical protein FJ651_03960 [Paucihalobacter ruber]